ncbi:transcriptional regulator, TetR family [Jatrophihabitans endophyticus]|uniref:Transcriptional regulator, TetR family n=1 Tax=Jatrophihabitans endophyticus TaxID=1206085 RepID=A0A1M5Q0I5_9ACTN|nr:TetR/AcrR family transcriptional regulator [Jatrophihabitans endophyticus]SHH07528.1 transcriptional regulator, TetR family [Jatrophihabitans endophyticus]
MSTPPTAPSPELTAILSAALDLFYESGYHGTSVRDIARRVGLTVPALYYHHENKEALLYALLDTSITEVIARCRAALECAGPAPADRFLQLIECIVLYIASNEKLAAMDAEIRSLGPQNRRRYGAKRRQVEVMLVTCIEDGVASGDFDVTSPAETARALLGMTQAVATWFRPGGRMSARTVARHYVDIAAHTVGAAPGRIAALRCR